MITDPFESMRESTDCSDSNNIETDCSQDAAVREAGTATSQPPMLTVRQAAALLGKSVRALERSLLGRWGNKLPEGWSARRISTESGEEWRVIPPQNFKTQIPGMQTTIWSDDAYDLNSGESIEDHGRETSYTGDFFKGCRQVVHRGLQRNDRAVEHATIVIDRSDEVENLLRELLSTQKALSEERRLHMEDIRIVAQLQGQMRLLESSTSESARIKAEFELNKREFEILKDKYNFMVALPWWKRLLGLRPKSSEQ